ncbi:MAG TPA: MFS transporter [Phototrophicaceae bacterium]|jgi:MFS family permease|nr:MFS transporter [Phototrophicaceae bacterium]
MEVVESAVSLKTGITGMRAFIVFWIGQVVSLLGTGMSSFALALWAWQLTGEATTLALMGLFQFTPGLLLGPVAGTLVDRWDRKLTLMVSDLGAGLTSVAVFVLYASGNLQIWHLYVAVAIASAFESFQFPAQSAAVTTMLSKDQYARASGMLGLAGSASHIFAPPLAGFLFAIIGINGILLIDIVTFIFAISMVLLIAVPNPPETSEGRASRSQGLGREVAYGFTYIFQRPALLGLQLTFFFINLFGTLSFVLTIPMILSRTGNNQGLAGIVVSFLGIGGLVGGLTLSIWGGPKRRIHGVLLGMAAVSLLGTMGLGLAQTGWGWIAGAFFSAAFIPVLNGSNQAIWQSKVAPDIQGRVFAVRRLIGQITAPLAMIIAGPLADRVFEPAMMPGGGLAGIFGGIVGTGPGAGMGLIFVISGMIGALIGLGGYLFPFIRNAEDLLPDHQTGAIQEKE